MWAERTREFIGMLMIGDGLLEILDPKRHVRLWAEGPRFWQRLTEPFLRHPGMTRTLGVLKLAAGLWLASRQFAGAEPGRRQGRRLAHRSLIPGRRKARLHHAATPRSARVAQARHGESRPGRILNLYPHRL